MKESGLTRYIFLSALRDAWKMLMPQVQFRNPVMFVAYIGAWIMSFSLIIDYMMAQLSWFTVHITVWVWFTILFANFASSLAEQRGKAQAAGLRQMQEQMYAKQIVNGITMKIPAKDLVQGDIILCQTGDFIPADGEVIEGIATLDESAITGESAPVIRESGGDRSRGRSG